MIIYDTVVTAYTTHKNSDYISGGKRVENNEKERDTSESYGRSTEWRLTQKKMTCKT